MDPLVIFLGECMSLLYFFFISTNMFWQMEFNDLGQSIRCFLWKLCCCYLHIINRTSLAYIPWAYYLGGLRSLQYEFLQYSCGSTPVWVLFLCIRQFSTIYFHILISSVLRNLKGICSQFLDLTRVNSHFISLSQKNGFMFLQSTTFLFFWSIEWK